jgi:hypothetical protein
MAGASESVADPESVESRTMDLWGLIALDPSNECRLEVEGRIRSFRQDMKLYVVVDNKRRRSV